MCCPGRHEVRPARPQQHPRRVAGLAAQRSAAQRSCQPAHSYRGVAAPGGGGGGLRRAAAADTEARLSSGPSGAARDEARDRLPAAMQGLLG